MAPTRTAAQAAQDENKDRLGRFSTKVHAEADIDLEVGSDGVDPDHPLTPPAPEYESQYEFQKAESFVPTYTDPYPKAEADEVVFYDECPRCGGRGHMEEYRHVMNGVCAKCGGHPEPYHKPVTAKTARARERARVSREKSREEKRLKSFLITDNAMRELIAEDPAWGWLPSLGNGEGDHPDRFLYSLRGQMDDTSRGIPELSEKQKAAGLAAIHRHFEQEASRAEGEARMAELPPLEGRQKVTGKILTVKEFENTFSYYGGTTRKMLVELDSGHKVWGTMPDAAYYNDELGQGDEIEFTATFEEDYQGRPGHAGFKRPKYQRKNNDDA